MPRFVTSPAHLTLATALAAAFVAGCDDGASTRNTAPQASISSSLTLVKAGTDVAFAAGATDAEDNIASYSWDFGDRTVATGAAFETIDHAFAATGSYVVTVVVTDERGLTAAGSVTIDVTPAGGPPTLTVECLEIRGRVVDETVHEVTIDGADAVPLSDGVFTWSDGTYASPESHSFDARDEGGNVDARTMTLTEM